jgi:hypothetical protein
MPEFSIMYPDDKPNPDTTKKVRALRDDCLAFKRFGLPARPSPHRPPVRPRLRLLAGRGDAATG